MGRWWVATFRPQDFDRAAALMIAEALSEACRREAPRLFVLAGGKTPAGVYRELAGLEGERWRLADLVLALGDERVAAPPEERNEALVRSTLLAGRLAEARLLAPPPGRDAAAVAEAYEELLVAAVGPEPVPAVALLGLGEDGHTASLFPGSRALAVRNRLVAPAHSPRPPRARVTLTVPVLARARRVFFLVRGKDKAGIVHALLAGERRLPASSIPFQGEVCLLADRDALP